MSRVEPTQDREQEKRENEQRTRQSVGRTPGKAEGEERDVQKALKNQEC